MLRPIRYFQSVIHNGSFSRAAEECHISQSAISRQIQALEREVEREYDRNVIGFQGEFLFAENLEEARLLVIGGRGFLPVEGIRTGRRLTPRSAVFRCVGAERGSPETTALSGRRITPAIT